MKKVKVSTHDKEVYIIESEKSVEELHDERVGEQAAILIGDHSFSRISIKNIFPYHEETESE